MQRLRLLFILVLFVGVFSPLTVFAQENSLFGPIIPQEGPCACKAQPNPAGGPAIDTAPSWGCVLDVGQNLINIGIALAVVFVVLVIAYAGFMLMTSGANPGRRTQARTLVGNAVFGLFVILVAFLAVDFVMKAVYNPTATFSGEQRLGPWNGILASREDGMCLAVTEPVPITTGIVGIVFGPPTGTGVVPVGEAKAPCAANNPACSVATIQTYGLTNRQAQAMSCIAMTESGGNPQVGYSKTGACGTFQITTRPGNWSNPRYHQSPCSTSSSCNNASCNLQTAMLMFRHQGYQPWTGKNPNGTHWNPNAVACVARYDPGN